MKHTPGPWDCEENKVFTADCEIRIGEFLAEDMESEEADANARLCSAAPEMKDALQNLLDWSLNYNVPTDLYTAGCAALAKTERK
jgi:hypothetical protein